ncbi:helix-turn-helix domain-containing protein [Chryseolinea lacunae]|uniref:AraC family transcriptional regulator n=1 Tax=Chryseolinea lacunae TaxID=2801331 RepID=A0ABS1KPY2_9BACT|nr:AraC family transcriptional regulator [Chryseolinea lacunae]MBL0740346.1 AraC family transcriptional regulator [Chryseolinea lacunae]
MRSEQIFNDYLSLLDRHLNDVLNGTSEDMFELRELAGQLFIHPTHLSNVVKALTGKHPCYFYEQKILAIAKDLLQNPALSINEVARKLTYDPSNFTKWFKTYGGMSPSQYRKQIPLGSMNLRAVA